MNTTHLFSLTLAFGLLSGCAPKVPMELLSARSAYASASAGPASTLVPAELHKAHVALLDAEAAFKEDPKGYHTADLAYVAQRKAELAATLAAHASSERSAQASNSQYQASQDAIMRDTKAQLGASQSDLAASQSDLAASQSAGAATSAQLATSEAARISADRRTAEAMAALAKLAAVKEEARGLVITLSGSVLFRSDEDALLPEAQTRLGQVADALMAEKERSIVVEGHTDSQGSDAYNADLSTRRAEAVRAFLVSRGYDAAKIRAVGVGEARPIADNNTAEGRANNRRVELVIQPKASASQ